MLPSKPIIVTRNNLTSQQQVCYNFVVICVSGGLPLDTVNINKDTGFAYLPKEFREAGYIGELEILKSDVAIIVMKPGVPTKLLIEGLQNTCEHLKLRVKLELIQG